MGKVNRRRRMRVAASAAIGLASAVSASSSIGESSSSSAAAKAMSTATLPHQSTPLTSIFSCGTSIKHLFHSASNPHTTHTLCPTGDSSICPSGELCYGGIPCPTTAASSQQGPSQDYYLLMEQQRNMEQHEMNRLLEERERGYVDRFVCGVSYARAEEDCSDILWEDNGEGDTHEGNGDVSTTTVFVPQNTAADYCPTGQSSTCPGSKKCYAAVSCPRQYHDPEPEIIGLDTSLRLLDLYAANADADYAYVVQLHHGYYQQTEALLDLDVNVTASYARTLFAELGGIRHQDGGEESSPSTTSLEWRSMIPSSILGAVSSILPTGIFVSSSSRDPLDELFDVGVVKEELNDAIVVVKESVASSTDGAGVSIQMLEAAVQKRARLSSGGGRKMI